MPFSTGDIDTPGKVGNGLGQAEMDRGCDVAYYVRGTDDSPLIAKRRTLRVVKQAKGWTHRLCMFSDLNSQT